MSISIPTDVVGWIFTSLDLILCIVLILLPAFKLDLSLAKFSDIGLRNMHLPKSLNWFHKEYSYRKQWLFKYAFSALTYIIVSFISTHLLHDDYKWYHKYPLYFWCSLLTFSIHQLKRCIEVLFIHQYSHNKMHFGSGIMIISAYFCMGLTMSYGNVTNNLSEEQLNDSTIIYIGLIVWLIGEIGNGACHMYLAYERKKIDDKGYIPLRHLPWIFRIFINPNMLFELIIWSGYCIIMRELNSLIILIAMMIYFFPRIYKTKQWYDSHPDGTIDIDTANTFEEEDEVIGTLDFDNNFDNNLKVKDTVGFHTTMQSTQIVQ